MLKWFKKLTDRLFGEENEEETLQANDYEYEEEYEQEKEHERVEQRPEFRFPIITDEEIYGWESDGVEEKSWAPNNGEAIEQTDDFEPIPLYENERWPEENQRITRSNNRQFINHQEQLAASVTREETVRKNDRLSKNEQLQADLKKIQNKQRTQRFTPSTVPSPIYGYTKPKVEKQPLRQVALKEFETEGLGQVHEKDIFVESIHKEGEIAKDEVVETLEDEHLAVEEGQEIQEDVQETSSMIEEVQQYEVANVEEYEENDHVSEQQRATEEQVEQSEVVQKEEVLEQDSYFEEIQPADERLDEVQVIDEQFTTQEEVPSEAQGTTEQAEKNDEKIVPFNVLMLKSDKRKLQARKFAQEIANEMKAKENPIEQPIEKTHERKESKEQLPMKETDVQEVVVDNSEQELVHEACEEVAQYAHYVHPEIDYLMPPESKIEDTDWLASQSEKLEESLSHFNVEATVINAVQGPTVTRFELTVGQGTKVSRVRNLADDLKLTLAARDIRIEAPIPGRSSIGIEIPNRQARAVRISEVIQTDVFQQSTSPLEAVLGLGLTGEPVTLDLREMPHGLIAGATGSGKSVCINSILVSLLYKASPADLKMMLIDPKMVELAPFNGIPHLISPVITDVKAATAALKWAVAEMERRYELLAHAGVRNIEGYNEQMTNNRQFSLKMPYLLIVIDELADLMMMAPADVEVSISRIAQKARACGIHLIIATQRPSVDVITGIIKANIPTRIAFSVSSQVDSRTMIDTVGAERLLGKGDMLYIGNGESVPVRLQGTFVTDDEIERIIEHVQNEASPRYLFGQEELLKSAQEEEEDPLFVPACQFIYEQNSASTSMLQRNFSIGYNRAAKLMDRMEELAFISPQRGSRARDVYLTEAELNKLTETIS